MRGLIYDLYRVLLPNYFECSILFYVVIFISGSKTARSAKQSRVILPCAYPGQAVSHTILVIKRVLKYQLLSMLHPQPVTLLFQSDSYVTQKWN